MSKDKNSVTDEDIKALEESVNGMKEAVEQFKFAWVKPRPVPVQKQWLSLEAEIWDTISRKIPLK